MQNSAYVYHGHFLDNLRYYGDSHLFSKNLTLTLTYEQIQECSIDLPVPSVENAPPCYRSCTVLTTALSQTGCIFGNNVPTVRLLCLDEAVSFTALVPFKCLHRIALLRVLHAARPIPPRKFAQRSNCVIFCGV